MADYYKQCVAEVLGIFVEDVTEDQRELAKQLTFYVRAPSAPFASRTDIEVRSEMLSVLACARPMLLACGPPRKDEL